MAEWYQICCTELFRSPFLITAKCSHTSEWRCQWRYLPLYRGWKIRITATKRIKVNSLGRAVWNLITQKATYSFEYAAFLCWHLLIFPGSFPPSIFSASELNFRVRYGNGWTLAAINTNYCQDITIDTSRILKTQLEPTIISWCKDILT